MSGRGYQSGRSGGRGGRGDFNGRGGRGGRGDNQGRGGRGDYGGRGGRDGGRGRGGRDSGGRSGGRGGGGGRNSHIASNPKSAQSNLIPVAMSPNFMFAIYGIKATDKNGEEIQSSGGRRRRNEMWTKGFHHMMTKMGRTEKQIKEIERTIFFDGSACYSARPIAGLRSADLPVAIWGGDETTTSGAGELGDCLEVVSVEPYAAPIELQRSMPAPPEGSAAVEHRCGTCPARAFVNAAAMLQHCREQGCTPFYRKPGLPPPAQPEVFVGYINRAINRAMNERMARWGREYIDPKSFTDPVDNQGRSYGVKLFRAYSCDFGLFRPRPNSKQLEVCLTVDLRAKVMRTKSLLHALIEQVRRGRFEDPIKMRWSNQDKLQAKKKWQSEVVIATYDKRCYTVKDLDFDHSASTLMIEGKGMSHADYFQNKKGIALEYPDAVPMITVIGRSGNDIHLPPELVCGNELDPQIKMKLPLFASFKPEQRTEAMKVIKNFLIPGAQTTREQGGGLLPAIGLRVRDETVSVPVEMIPLPLIMVAGVPLPSSESVKKFWAEPASRANFKVQPGQAVELNVVLIYHRSLKHFTDEVFGRICKTVNTFGSKFRFKEGSFDRIEAGDMKDHWNAVSSYLTTTKVKPNTFFLDFLKPPARQAHDQAYPIVKQILGEAGHLSQFVNFNTLHHGEVHSDERKFKRSTVILGGVSRQILSKCGVRVWWVDIPRSLPVPAVVIGIDVYHAPRRYDPIKDKKVAKASVAAVIVQLIRSHKYNDTVEIYAETEQREGGMELKLDTVLEGAVKTALGIFKVEPKSCIIWRDGVGTETIKESTEQEVGAVRRALKGNHIPGAGEAKAPVPLSYIVCQKRINTKFISDDGMQMMPAGSLIRTLQGYEYNTFYINGTAPPNSTSKPCRFIVSVRDPQLMACNLEQLTWSMCHDYNNWTGPVKLPAPVQNAHKLAELAGNTPQGGDTFNYKAYANKLFFL